LYIRKHFKPEAKDDIEDIVDMIREAFGTILSEEVRYDFFSKRGSHIKNV